MHLLIGMRLNRARETTSERSPRSTTCAAAGGVLQDIDSVMQTRKLT